MHGMETARAHGMLYRKLKAYNAVGLEIPNPKLFALARSGMRFMPDINSRKMLGNKKLLPNLTVEGQGSEGQIAEALRDGQFRREDVVFA